jgi:hypothetical protein
MSILPLEEVELVGFAGSVAAECGSASPIARHGDNYLLFEATDQGLHADRVFSQSEILHYAEAGQLTLLNFEDSEPIRAFENAIATFATKSVFQSIGIHGPPATLRKRPLAWFSVPIEALSPDHEDAWVVFLSIERSHQLRNGWGERFLDKSTHLLRRYLRNGQRKDLQAATRLTDVSLTVAVSPSLRETLYGRHALSLRLSSRPEAATNLFELVMKREFGWIDYTLDSFLGRLEVLQRLLSDPGTHVVAAAAARGNGPLHWLREYVERSRQLETPQQQMEFAQTAVREFEERFQEPGRWGATSDLKKLASKIKLTSACILDDGLAFWIAREKAIYLPSRQPLIEFHDRTPCLKVFRFMDELHMCHGKNVQLGPLGSCFLTART